YTIIDFQIKSNSYYVMSIQGAPYLHNYVLKSVDFGETWIELYDTVGLFYTFTMVDTAFGIMGGTSGGYAMTEGNDTSWAMDSLYSLLGASAYYDDSTLIILPIHGMSSFRTN